MMKQTALISSVEWRTFPTGYAHPIIIFENPVVFKSEGNKDITLHLYIVKDIKLISKFELGVGKTVDLECKILSKDYFDVEIIGSHGDDVIHHNPYNCLTCNHLLVEDKFGLYCSNLMCPSKSTTSIFRLYSVFSVERDYQGFKHYLNSFPTYEGPVMIKNINEYLTMLKQIGEPNIEARYQAVAKINPDYHTFEVDLYRKLRNGQLLNDSKESNGILWFTINLAGLGLSNCMEILGDVYPFAEDIHDKLKLYKVDKELILLILQHQHNIRSLGSLIKSFQFDK